MPETARDLITNALLDLGVLADGESPTASQAVGALRKLNNLIEAWNIEGLMVYGFTPYTFPLQSGVSTYTLGPGGDFNIPRPTTIQSAYIASSTLPVTDRYAFPLYIYNNAEWADVRIKGMTSTFPLGIYIDDSFPLLSLNIWPVPSSNEYNLILWANGMINSLGLDDEISLAPGYKRALEASLVIELSPSYGQTPSEVTVAIARTAKENIRIKNLQINELMLDPRLAPGQYDILTNRYYP